MIPQSGYGLMHKILSEDENRILATPFKDLTKEQRSAAFSLSDRVADHNRKQAYSNKSKFNITISDRDVLLKNGVTSPIDPKQAFTNRREWAEHLKRNDCVEIGNDYNNAKPPTEIKGDFNCRKELSQATHQVMEKYGH